MIGGLSDSMDDYHERAAMINLLEELSFLSEGFANWKQEAQDVLKSAFGLKRDVDFVPFAVRKLTPQRNLSRASEYILQCKCKCKTSILSRDQSFIKRSILWRSVNLPFRKQLRAKDLVFGIKARARWCINRKAKTAVCGLFEG